MQVAYNRLDRSIYLPFREGYAPLLHWLISPYRLLCLQAAKSERDAVVVVGVVVVDITVVVHVAKVSAIGAPRRT